MANVVLCDVCTRQPARNWREATLELDGVSRKVTVHFHAERAASYDLCDVCFHRALTIFLESGLFRIDPKSVSHS